MHSEDGAEDEEDEVEQADGMDLVLAQEELWDPSGQQFQNTAQVDYQVQEILDSPHDLRMISDRHSLDLFEDKEQFACHIV